MSFYVGTLDRRSVINNALAKLLGKELNDLKFETKNCAGVKGPPMKVNVFEVNFLEATMLSQSIWKKFIYIYRRVSPNSKDVQLFDVSLDKSVQV